MSDKNFRAKDVRDFFRPDESLMYRNGFPAHLKEPGYLYSRVIYKTPAGFYKNDPYHVQKHLDRGWEFVYEKGKAVKSKANAEQEKENIRPDPIQYTSPDGSVSYFMRISEKLFHENKSKDRQERDKKIKGSVIRKSKTHEEDKEMIDLNEFAGLK